MDPAFHSALAYALGTTINRALAYDPGSQAALERLAGKHLEIDLRRPDIRFYFGFDHHNVRVLSHYEGEPDCKVTGSAPSVVSLLWRERHTLAGSGVEISGDAGLISTLQDILTDLDLDWEQIFTEAFSRMTTPAAAELLSYPLIRFLRGGAQQIRRHAAITPDWMRDYLTEEIRVLASPYEVRAFAAKVDEVRAATDRLDARIRKLRQQLDQQNPPQ